MRKCAGLKLNKEKSEALALGKINKSKNMCGITTSDIPIKVLRVWISKDMNEIYQLNFNERLNKFKHLLNMWKQRRLSLKGKVTIINT